MTSSEGEGQPPRRKRSRTSANGDDAGSKKARGRPRVDTQDATAADRRRTQIRLAQRAYRQRKETTISSLKQENARLQSIVEQMNTYFLRFNDSALKLGLLQWNPALGHELKHVTETFVALAKSASDLGRDDEEGEVDEATLDLAVEPHHVAPITRASREQPQTHNSLPVPEQTNVGWGYTLTVEERLSSRNSRADPLHHSNFLQKPSGVSNQRSLIRSRPKPLFCTSVSVAQIMDPSRSSPTNDASQQQALPFGLVDFSFGDRHSYSPPPGNTNPRISNVNVSSPLIAPRVTKLPTAPLLPSLLTNRLKPPWTYSHEETTFARRLTRASLEAGFHLLSGTNLNPATLNYVFKLSLPYMSPDDLRARFKTILARSTEEDLDYWDTPFIHLGGAGTHYPRKDPHGNIVPIPNSWTVRSIGPPDAKLVRAESRVDPSQNHDLHIDLTGFEGEWFDAYDVQGYLEEEKSCHIDPKESFAEVFIEVEDKPGSDHARLGSLLFSKQTNLDLEDLSPSACSSSEQSPSLSNASSNEPYLSNKSPSGNSAGGMDAMFSQQQSQADAAPFGLDMGNVGSFDFGKSNVLDQSSLHDQPLGLDLVPGFDAHLNTAMAGFGTTASGEMSNLGLDLMCGEVEQALSVVKMKAKKAAWIDVTKFIDEIIKHGVCLGRAPGFRRKDVDTAFNAALITSF
ncbi:hypothetical protein K504DRAFT_370138 [Pleomassaria siparia CBS 279.74]|uniref:BZIP domain-containing protein n=1 Tax=Pleomassaria siparia CBS 279.74 TaxID=1314801 RepID=A0A6G1KMT8_9PLEO|nr:hypothetical protein K504DRAFT_370138 [Pleomassaria siparia CBS 279.74]